MAEQNACGHYRIIGEIFKDSKCRHSILTCFASILRAGKLKLESNNEPSPLCLEPTEQTRGVSKALCEFQSVGGVIVSNYPFIVHAASQQEPVALYPPRPPPRLPVLIHIMLVCVCSVGPNHITACTPCVNVLMKTMLRLNLNSRLFSMKANIPHFLQRI